MEHTERVLEDRFPPWRAFPVHHRSPSAQVPRISSGASFPALTGSPTRFASRSFATWSDTRRSSGSVGASPLNLDAGREDDRIEVFAPIDAPKSGGGGVEQRREAAMAYAPIRTADDAAGLILGRTLEDGYLDFKSEPWRGNADGRRECARDVAQFANASGGSGRARSCAEWLQRSSGRRRAAAVGW